MATAALINCRRAVLDRPPCQPDPCPDIHAAGKAARARAWQAWPSSNWLSRSSHVAWATAWALFQLVVRWPLFDTGAPAAVKLTVLAAAAAGTLFFCAICWRAASVPAEPTKLLLGDPGILGQARVQPDGGGPVSVDFMAARSARIKISLLFRSSLTVPSFEVSLLTIRWELWSPVSLWILFRSAECELLLFRASTLLLRHQQLGL